MNNFVRILLFFVYLCNNVSVIQIYTLTVSSDFLKILMLMPSILTVK